MNDFNLLYNQYLAEFEAYLQEYTQNLKTKPAILGESMAYSLAGAVLSLVLMVVLKKLDLFSTVGVSIAGGVSHNLGQIIVAMLVMETAEIGYYMIVLAVTGTLAGAFIGLAGSILLKYMKNVKI